MGPDALDVGRAGFLRLLETRRGRIKAVLLDQSFIAGVGNLLADEALWRARIHPARPVDAIPVDERITLFRELRSVIRRQTVDRYPEGFRSRWNDARGATGLDALGAEPSSRGPSSAAERPISVRAASRGEEDLPALRS